MGASSDNSPINVVDSPGISSIQLSDQITGAIKPPAHKQFDRGQLITAETIDRVPLLTRNVFDLVQLSAGVTPANGSLNSSSSFAITNISSGRPCVDISSYTINGAIVGSVYYMVDGSPLGVAENNAAAIIAMLFTSVSYGRMAPIYPHGGSAFLYVGKQIHPGLGFMTGWCLVMDYILNPIICTIWCTRAAINFVPTVPYVIWVCAFALLFTTLNCNGMETSARINAGMAAALGIVILLVVVAAFRYLFHLESYPVGFLTHPFFDRATFTSSGLMRGTSIAVLTYIGFDGISTLSDEAINPARSVPRAIVWTCVITGVLASIEVYLGQLAWPQSKPFPDIDTAYVYISGRVGGPLLFAIVNGALLLATVGSGMASQLGAARLMLAMGQDGALPKRFFGEIHPRNRIPRNNVLLIGVLCVAGALLLSYQIGTELLNYGALLAFMGVNIASLLQAWKEGRLKLWLPMLLGVCGFATCFVIWLNLSRTAWIAGSIWAGTGVVLWVIRRRQIHLPGADHL